MTEPEVGRFSSINVHAAMEVCMRKVELSV